MFDEDAELLIVAHQRSADAASVLDTGTAQFALRVGKVADTLRVALDIALFGGLSDSQYGLPPLVAISRNGRPAVLYRFASLIFYQYLRAIAVTSGMGEGNASGADDDAVLTAVDSSFINDTL